MRQFLDSLRPRDGAPAVLRGTCFERDSVPLKGIDVLVDSLLDYLKSCDEDTLRQLIPRDVGALAVLFPVLDEIEALRYGRVAADVDPIELF